ncbi:EGF-like domain-containing protein 1 [Gigantopelta aegis]|uniref:EGF-like domain-containing protein 1 n=1 Tax=Gigantopelta aegis TaxID=1735272 RepID=UPI001B88AF78|nr:EGF-like domain-containing protein 1 [Gigantopelta aegis]
MRRTVIQIALCLLAVSLTHGGPFNCLRASQSCPAGATCRPDGKCQCPSTLEGDDCSIVIAAKGGRACRRIRCRNGGVCVRRGSGAGCACTVDYYGVDCSFKRYNVLCQDQEILFNINPVGTFHGSAFLENMEHKSQCRGFPISDEGVDGIPESWEGYVVRIPHNSIHCGSIIARPSQSGDRYVFERKIMVRYEDSIITTYDDVFLGFCEVRNQVVVRSRNIRVKDDDHTGGASLHQGSAVVVAVCVVAAVWRQGFDSWIIL